MRFDIQREALLKPLQQVNGVVERRQTLPVLANVLICKSVDSIALTGTDLEVELVGRAVVEGGESGEVTVPARKFMDICRELPEGAKVSLETVDNRLLIKCGRFRSTLSTLPASEFPSVDRSSVDFSAELPADGFRRLLDKTAFAMAQQDVRYFLNGMLLDFGPGGVRSVATDGHRLATSFLAAQSPGQSPRKVIVPRKGVVELQRLLGDMEGPVRISLGGNHLCAQTGDATLTTKLVDGKFPDYERVIPRDGNRVVVGDRLELRQALNRTAILSNEKFRGISVGLETGLLTLSAHNPEQEEAEESVAVRFEGEPVEIGFNVGYLQDVLTVIDSPEVRLTLRDGNSSALVESPDDDSAVYVVMPMKL